MSKSLTSNKLIASVKRRAQIPANQNTFKEEDFLAFANEEMQLGLVPSVLQLHEDYFLWDIEVPLEENKSNYRIPYRAIGNKLRNVTYKDTNGNLYEMTRISDDEKVDYNGGYTFGYQTAFRVKNNEIVIEPNIKGAVTGSLVFTFYIRPNDLVPENQTGTITGIDRNTGVITVSALPTKFNAQEKYDFIEGQSPHTHLSIDIEIMSVNSVQKTVMLNPASIPADLQKGDYICFAQETPVPQIPTDLHVVLAHRVAARCLEASGDTQGLSNANLKLQEFEQKTQNVIDNRVEDAPLKVKNRHGTLRNGLVTRRFSRRSMR